jgi:hypothetical protein
LLILAVGAPGRGLSSLLQLLQIRGKYINFFQKILNWLDQLALICVLDQIKYDRYGHSYAPGAVLLGSM